MRWPARLIAALGIWGTLVAAGVLTLGVVAHELAPVAGLRRPVDADAAPLPELVPLARRSVVRAGNGEVLAVLLEEDREPIALSEVPSSLLSAVLATEDAQFFEHRGIDPRGIVRALLANARDGGVSQGGSTITQQVVKKEFLADRRDAGRKVREAALALRLERELDKEQILERYLNSVYFGEGAHGVQAAAERFFGKHVRDLIPAESALLAGLIASPNRYNPFQHPERARSRRDHVVGRMVDEGYLTPGGAEMARAMPVPTQVHRTLPTPNDYFVEEVKRRLLADPRMGATSQERSDLLFRGGLRIETTLDPGLQAVADRAVRETLPASPFTAALVALDPATGEVRAMVGGPGFAEAKFNLVTQGARQPGSAFKAVTLAAAIEAGYSPFDMVDGTAPCTLLAPGAREPWEVGNYEGEGGGIVPLYEATAKSQNCAYARLVMGLGPEKVAGMAERLGIARRLDAVPSITLGAEEVTPLELATVFSTLAADGVRHDPVFVRRVVAPDGRVVLENNAEGRQVVDTHVARTVSHTLTNVVLFGTGRRADIGRPVAGKTGTSQEWRDAWFGGYTPQLATVVWMGSPVGQISMTNVAGTRVTGGSFPAGIWARFTAAALGGQPVVPFPLPDMSRWPVPAFISETGRLPVPPPPPLPAPVPAPAVSDAAASQPVDGGGEPGKKSRGGG